jgi:hypothetical protein
VLILVILSVLGESGLSVGDSKVAGRHRASKSEAARRKFSPGCGPHGKFSAVRVTVCLGWLRRPLLPQARALDAVGFARCSCADEHSMRHVFVTRLEARAEYNFKPQQLPLSSVHTGISIILTLAQ